MADRTGRDILREVALGLGSALGAAFIATAFHAHLLVILGAGAGACFAVVGVVEVMERRKRRKLLPRPTESHELEAPAPESRHEPQPLQPHYEEREPYCQPNGHMSEHRIGIRNPAGNPEATGVRLHWIGMSPQPKTDLGYPPVTPQAVPVLTGGDPAIGISLPSRREELWVIATTATEPESGTMTAGVFSPRWRPTWHGTPWYFERDDRWRFSYRIVADNLPAATFSVVMTAVKGRLRCELQG